MSVVSSCQKPGRTSGRFRLYTEDDLVRLTFIREMQGLGFSLDEIKQLASLRGRGADACSTVRDLLNTKLKAVRAKIQQLQELESELSADLRKCNRELRRRQSRNPSACPLLKGDDQ
jgi:MerR family transcriptional regulator, mercuric resistance operon regulatory protein